MNKIKVFAGAFLCCFLWGSAFPVIKIGYERWGIANDETMRIIGFAGVRFFLAGILVVLAISLIRRKWLVPKAGEIPKIFLLSLFQTIGQYVLFGSGMPLPDEGMDPTPALLILLYLALVSSVAYTLWGLLLKKNDVSQISVFGFMTPISGVILSALLLGESGVLGWQYIASLVLVSLGIVVVNYQGKGESREA